MRVKNYTPLRLLAADPEDLEVIAAYMQDAALKVGDMAYLPSQRRFALVANRFVWEEGVSKRFGPFTRVRAGLHFDDVKKVRSKNIRMDAKQAIVVLLSVSCRKGPDGDDIIQLEFAGGGIIELLVEAINASIQDISTPWHTQNRPDHGLD
ncbi:MAG: DUF2948 family protein [bacterium]